MSSKRAITGAIFDCDGTLLDSLPRWRGVEQMLAHEAGAVVTPEESDLFVSFTIPEVAQYFHEHFGLGANVSAVVGMIDDYMMAYYEGAAQLLPGVGTLLESCASNGVRMSVASSSAHLYLETGLKRVGVFDLFDAVLSVDDVAASKREPLIFARAREAMDTDIPLTWGFDDSVYAIQTMRDAGFPVVGIFDQETEADRAAVEQASTCAVGNLEGVLVSAGELVLP